MEAVRDQPTAWVAVEGPAWKIDNTDNAEPPPTTCRLPVRGVTSSFAYTAFKDSASDLVVRNMDWERGLKAFYRRRMCQAVFTTMVS